MIWFHGYSLLLGMKSKCLAGLIDWAVSSLSFCFLRSIIWKCKWLGGSPHLLCHLLLHVGCSVCCSQPLRLTYSISSTIQTGYIFWKGADCCSFFSLYLALAVAWQRRGSSAGFLQSPACACQLSFGLSGPFVLGEGLSQLAHYHVQLDMAFQC